MDKGDRKLHASKAHKEEKSFLNRRNELFRRLPKIDRIMGMELTKELTEQYGYRAVLEAARKVEDASADFGGRKAGCVPGYIRTIRTEGWLTSKAV